MHDEWSFLIIYTFVRIYIKLISKCCVASKIPLCVRTDAPPDV